MMVTKDDFNELFIFASVFNEDLAEDPKRFELLGAGELDATSGGKMIYWFGEQYAAVMFAKIFLEENGYEYQSAWDILTTQGEDLNYGYVIITKYGFESFGKRKLPS